ncbi:MAG TPA: anti-sigma factor [Bacillales bacterium]|nr:anti-sigma factor [Bacillales bacterium]
MNCRNGWREEEVVDFVLNRLAKDKSEAFQRHLPDCQVCQEQQSEWAAMFDDESAERLDAPSVGVKRKLMRRLQPARVRRPWKRMLRPHFYFTAAAALAMVFALVDMFPPGMPQHSERPGNGVVDGRAANFVNIPGANNVQNVSVSDENIEGYLWLNRSTDELLLFLDGLPRVSGKDYQAWLVKNNDRRDAGLLKVTQGVASLYVRRSGVGQFHHIVVTIEPKGGSVAQTGPRRLVVQWDDE